ncbi:MAG: hypothetical protein ABGW69_02510 [Nanoarchaeota archaeon]
MNKSKSKVLAFISILDINQINVIINLKNIINVKIKNKITFLSVNEKNMRTNKNKK